jgi:hypothetical protein
VKKILLLFIIVAIYTTSTATVRFVSKTGSSTPPYTSWATAADSIQKCINFSQGGDTIYVANGTYFEQVVMRPGLTLIGSGMDSCIIDTRALAQPTDFIAVRVKENGTLKGFHIRVSNNRWGVGIWVYSSPVVLQMNGYIENNKVTNSGFGMWLVDLDGGICKENIITSAGKGIIINNFWDSQPIVEKNYISNVETDGITISFGGSSIIRNNTIVDNDLIYGFIGGAADTLYLSNNEMLISNAMASVLNLTLAITKCENNIVEGYGNESGIKGRNNNIIMNNTVTSGESGIVRFNNESPLIKYNNSWNNEENYSNFTPDSTNISVDPMFMDVENQDFHLQAFSPLIDAGDPSILDKDGSRSDIGLYGGPYGESYLYIDLPPKAPRNILGSLDSGIINLRWNKNTEADLKYYNIYRDTVNNFTIDSSNIIASTSDTLYSEPFTGSNDLYYKITAVDGTENESLPGEEVTILAVGVKEPKVMLENYILYQNYPNPFNPTTTIGYKLGTEGYVKLNVYDIKGEKITELENSYQKPGYYEVIFGGSDKGKGLASGIYLYKLEITKNGIPVYTSLKKMIQLK